MSKAKLQCPPGSNRIAETSSPASPLQLFHFGSQGAACFGFGDHRLLPGENEIEPGF
jgi:hypothetical protein